MKALFAITLLAASLVYGQEKPEPREPSEAAVIPVKTLTGEAFSRLVRLLGAFPGKFTADDQLKTIVVYAPKDVVAQVRKVVEQLDQPGSEASIGRNIELTMTLLRCSTKSSAIPESLPPDMESVARQLRAATQYKDIQLLEIVPFHLQEGKLTTEKLRLPWPTEGNEKFAKGEIRLQPDAVGHRHQARYVRFSQVNIDLDVPVYAEKGALMANFVNVGIKTAGDFTEGQKTVLGKVSGADADSAIFVVIALKVLD